MASMVLLALMRCCVKVMAIFLMLIVLAVGAYGTLLILQHGYWHTADADADLLTTHVHKGIIKKVIKVSTLCFRHLSVSP